MRWLLPLVIVLVAACPQSSNELAAVGDDDRGPPDPSGQSPNCFDDSDCELAASTCCDCKTFATSAGDPKLDACDGVMCPPPQKTCSRIRAVCEESRCVIACEPQAVTMSCATGFAADTLGCLIDACAQPKSECTTDDECVQTRDDCCGCQRGGIDTAVPNSSRDAYDTMLGCTGDEVCPEVSTCDAAATPQCAQGSCRLVAGELPSDACGRPDLPACPTGTVCTVNANDTADLHGVGVCRAP